MAGSPDAFSFYFSVQPFRNAPGDVFRLVVTSLEFTPYMKRDGYDNIDRVVKRTGYKLIAQHISKMYGVFPEAMIFHVVDYRAVSAMR